MLLVFSFLENVINDGKYDVDIGNKQSLGFGWHDEPVSGLGLGGQFDIPNGDLRVGVGVGGWNGLFSGKFDPTLNIGFSETFGK